MAQANNALQPLTLDPLKFLQRLPDFSGDRKELYSFIALVDRINPILIQYDELSQLLFFDIIKSKLKDKAKETMEINFHAQSWTEIRIILMNNFGEKHSVEELYDRLRSVVFKTNAIDFYNEIKEKLRSLNNKTSTDFGINANSEQTARNNMKTALNIFKEKIPEPMRTILACRNPNTLEDAMDILFNSGYANYGVKNRNNTFNRLDNSNNRSRIYTNVSSNYETHENNGTGQRFKTNRNKYFTNRWETQNNQTDISRQTYNNNRFQHNSNNNNSNRNNYQYNPNNRQNFRNNFTNSQSHPSLPEPMDINYIQDSNRPVISNLNNNNNNTNRYSYQYNYKTGQHFRNNFTNSQNQQSFEDPRDINIIQNSNRQERMPQNTSVINYSTNTQVPHHIPLNQNETIQNFPFQASPESYHI
ncbi:uncharacterized protein DDB_G0287625-like [Calliphora vicina]|uniref:uncharacterized protein DDB_G0287625-like n=1 Tax=Calliphora vicina TaxID=7373 RepID=UPI00325B0D1D